MDPLLVEAREIASNYYDNGALADLIQEGKQDNGPAVKAAYKALRRGIEIGKGG